MLHVVGGGSCEASPYPDGNIPQISKKVLLSMLIYCECVFYKIYNFIAEVHRFVNAMTYLLAKEIFLC